MNKPSLGETSLENALLGLRDAHHLHIILVESDDILEAGDNVRFTDNTFTKVQLCSKSERHAVVDPFLEDDFYREFFWVCLKPGMAKNLVHHYEIDETGIVQKSTPPKPKYIAEDDDDECGTCS